MIDQVPAAEPASEEVVPDLIAENQRLKLELADANLKAARNHVELLQQRRTSLKIETSLIETKLLPDAVQAFNELVQEREALQPKPSE